MRFHFIFFLAANDIRNKISRLYKAYLELFNNDVNLAQAVMPNVTDGRASKDWTEEDMKILSDDLALRMQKRVVMEEILKGNNINHDII